MTCLRTRLGRMLLLAASAASAAGCSAARADAAPEVALVQQAQVLKDLAAQCGLACPGDKDDKGVVIKGIADGNAAISGVASVDAFFSSVVKFKNTANGVAKGIDVQLNAIKTDFGIAADVDVVAGLMTQFDANLETGFKLEAEPPRCSADVRATLQAKVRCEGEVSPGMVEVACKGSCELDASVEAKCEADADLQCTIVPPNLECSGSCQGTCSANLTAAVSCSGTCRGSCSGGCSAYVKNAQGDAECAGQCDGNCMGQCETELAAGARCMGQCKGECTLTNPEAGCEGAIRAECKAKADAMLMCKGKCTGEVEPPSAKVECQATAKADAKLNVQCTPPRVAMVYKLKASVTGMARLKFEAALKTLIDARLPALKAAIAQGDSVVSAGGDLSGAAGGALKGAFEVAGKASVKTQFGLGCAVGQLDAAADVIGKANTNLNGRISTANNLIAKLGGQS